MTSRRTRRDVLAGSGLIALSIAGCLGSDGDEPTASDIAPPPSPVGPDEWPAYQWKQRTASPPREVLADPSSGRLYIYTEDETAAYAADGRRLWKRESVGRARAATGDGYLAVDEGRLFAVDGASGETRWSVSVGERATVLAAALLEGETYAVATRIDSASTRIDDEFARLCRVDREADELVRLTDLPGPPANGWFVTSAGDAIYLVRDDGLVVACDSDGTERWRSDLRSGEEEPVTHAAPEEEVEEEEENEPALASERTTGENLAIRFGGVAAGTLFVGVRGGLETVHALATDTGDLLWERRNYGAVQSATEERVLLAGGSAVAGGRFAAVDPATGEDRWSRTIDRGFVDDRYGATIDGNHYAALWLDDGPASVVVLDVATGDTVDEAPLETERLYGPALLADRLVFGVVDGETGQLRATPLLDADR